MRKYIKLLDKLVFLCMTQCRSITPTRNWWTPMLELFGYLLRVGSNRPNLLEGERCRNIEVGVGNMQSVIRIRLFHGTLGLRRSFYFFGPEENARVGVGGIMLVIRIRSFRRTLGLGLCFP